MVAGDGMRATRACRRAGEGRGWGGEWRTLGDGPGWWGAALSSPNRHPAARAGVHATSDLPSNRMASLTGDATPAVGRDTRAPAT